MKKYAFEVGTLVRRRHNWTVEGDLKSNFTGIVVSRHAPPPVPSAAPHHRVPSVPSYQVAWFNGNIGRCKEYVLEAL
jgi:hypothetical protein